MRFGLRQLIKMLRKQLFSYQLGPSDNIKVLKMEITNLFFVALWKNRYWTNREATAQKNLEHECLSFSHLCRDGSMGGDWGDRPH